MKAPIKKTTHTPANELEITGLHKKFGEFQVLSNITFSVKPGVFLGLIGPNGAGKSTLMECIAALMPVDSGRISWQNNILPTGRRKEVIWYQPDNILPFAEQRVTEILVFFRQVHARDAAELTALITGLQLEAVLAKPLQTLSKGYRRRTLLAIALLSRQPVLMLDEPFDGLDLRQSLSVMDLLRTHCKNRSLILSIHQLSEAEKICDRFLLLDQGKVLGFGTRDELRRQTHLKPDASLEEVFLAIT